MSQNDSGYRETILSAKLLNCFRPGLGQTAYTSEHISLIISRRSAGAGLSSRESAERSAGGIFSQETSKVSKVVDFGVDGVIGIERTLELDGDDNWLCAVDALLVTARAAAVFVIQQVHKYSENLPKQRV